MIDTNITANAKAFKRSTRRTSIFSWIIGRALARGLERTVRTEGGAKGKSRLPAGDI